MCAARGGQSVCRDAKKALRTATALRSWIAEVRRDVALGFETVEGCVNSPDGDFASRSLFNFLSHCDAISTVFEAKEREKNDVFKFAEIAVSSH